VRRSHEKCLMTFVRGFRGILSRFPRRLVPGDVQSNSQDIDMRTHINRAATMSRCAKYFKTQQRAVINPHDKYVYNSRWYMDTWILVYIIMGDKEADIPCAVTTVTNNIIPTGVRRRRRRGITRPYTYLFISMEILYRCQDKKNSYIRVKSLGISWLA